MTSSPRWMWVRWAAISRASVPEVVSRHSAVPVFSSRKALHFFVNGPSPLILWFSSTAMRMFSISVPTKGGTLNGI